MPEICRCRNLQPPYRMNQKETPAGVSFLFYGNHETLSRSSGVRVELYEYSTTQFNLL